MARYNLFVLKVPLNPKQASKQTYSAPKTPAGVLDYMEGKERRGE